MGWKGKIIKIKIFINNLKVFKMDFIKKIMMCYFLNGDILKK